MPFSFRRFLIIVVLAAESALDPARAAALNDDQEPAFAGWRMAQSHITAEPDSAR